MIFSFFSGSNYPPITKNIIDYNSVDKSNYDLTDWTGTYYLLPPSGDDVSGSIDISGSSVVSITIPTTLSPECYSLYMQFGSGSHTMIIPQLQFEESAFVKILPRDF